jgi:hypothetical protein
MLEEEFLLTGKEWRVPGRQAAIALILDKSEVDVAWTV